MAADCELLCLVCFYSNFPNHFLKSKQSAKQKLKPYIVTFANFCGVNTVHLDLRGSYVLTHVSPAENTASEKPI